MNLKLDQYFGEKNCIGTIVGYMPRLIWIESSTMPSNVIAFVKSVSSFRYLYLNMILMIQNVNCQCSGGGHLGFMPKLIF